MGRDRRCSRLAGAAPTAAQKVRPPRRWHRTFPASLPRLLSLASRASVAYKRYMCMYICQISDRLACMQRTHIVRVLTLPPRATYIPHALIAPTVACGWSLLDSSPRLASSTTAILPECGFRRWSRRATSDSQVPGLTFRRARNYCMRALCWVYSEYPKSLLGHCTGRKPVLVFWARANWDAGLPLVFSCSCNSFHTRDIMGMPHRRPC